MHAGNKNNKFSYGMNGKVLDKVLVEKDLGIMISSGVKSFIVCYIVTFYRLILLIDIFIFLFNSGLSVFH